MIPPPAQPILTALPRQTSSPGWPSAKAFCSIPDEPAKCVRLPERVEQELAEYCTKHRLSKSEAVKLALDKLLVASAGKPSPYDLGKDLFGPHTDATPTEDTARNSKRLLREYFRGKGK